MLINLSVSPASGVAETFTGSSVTHTEQGVTYNFDSTVTYGFYANGEPFVVSGGSDVVITSITPAGVNDAGRDKNGTVVQPRDDTGTNYAAFDSQLSNYDGTQNVDPGKTAGNLTISAATWPGGASVVKAVSRATQSSRSWIENYSVLTVVPAIPAMVDPFRPPIRGTDKTSYYKLADLDMTKVKSLTPVTSQPTTADYSATEGAVFVTWREDDISAWRDMQPAAYHTEYGASQKTAVSNMLMAFHNSSETATAKRPLMIALVQEGIDICGGIDAGQGYSPNTGHNDEYKPAAVLAAVMLGQPTALVTASQTAGRFGDDTDTLILASGDIGVDYNQEGVNSVIPGKGAKYDPVREGYAEWQNSPRPNPALTAQYRGIYWRNNPTLALGMEMLGSGEAKTVWNNAAFWELAWRHSKIFEVSPIPTGNTANQASAVALDFWDTQAATYFTTSTALLPEEPIAILAQASGSELVITIARNALIYDNKTADFAVGSTLTGGTSGATAKIVKVGNTAMTQGASGIIYLADITGGPFTNNETITDGATGSAQARDGSFDITLTGTQALSQIDMRYSTDRATWTTLTNTGAETTTSGLSANTYYYVGARYVTSVGNGPWTMNHVQYKVEDIEADLGLTWKTQTFRDKLQDMYDLAAGSEADAVVHVQGVQQTST